MLCTAEGEIVCQIKWGFMNLLSYVYSFSDVFDDGFTMIVIGHNVHIRLFNLCQFWSNYQVQSSFKL